MISTSSGKEGKSVVGRMLAHGVIVNREQINKNTYNMVALTCQCLS